MAHSTQPKHVALAMPLGLPQSELHMQGILQYASEHGRWVMGVSPESTLIPLSSLRDWSGDGIIATIDTPEDAQLVAKLKIPAVNVSGALKDPGIPRVTVDNQVVGRMAAEHLLECGFRHFAYYGVRDLWYSQERFAGFRARVEASGSACSVLMVPHTLGKRVAWAEVDHSLCNWLAELNRPVGVLACSDYRARMLLDACRQLELCVPDELAVLGVNNDEMACQYCNPPLSSVSRNADQVGYAAAALLDRLMAGHPPPKSDVLIAPDKVVRRRSTDVVAVDDPEVAAAVRYMRDHLSEPITIGQVAHRQGISRRWLQDAFQRLLGRSPHVYLNYLRIRRARQLLVEHPNMTVLAVAKACGFSDAKRLRASFVRFTGIGLQEYRQQHCGKPASEVDRAAKHASV